MKVLVTGATGFLGSNLVRELIKVGHQVRVTYRANSNLLPLKGLNLEKIKADITNLEEAELAVKDCQIIMHLASLYQFYPWWQKNTAEIYKVNVQATKNLIQLALKYKIKRFLFTSSIATFKDKNKSVNTSFKISHYARSKRLAELEVEKACQQGLPAVILNPAIIIGEGDYKPTPSGQIILKFLNREYPFYFSANLPVVSASQVVKVHLNAISKGKPGKKYLIANDKVYSLKEFFKLMEQLSGVKPPSLKIPYFIVLLLAYFDELLSQILSKKYFLPVEGIKFCKNAPRDFNNQPAKTDLGYKSIPIADSLKRAISWYQDNGYRKDANLNLLAKDINLSGKFFLYFVKFLYFLSRLGFYADKDSWRKVTENYLRTEHAKFILGCFRLKLPKVSKEQDSKKAVINKLKFFIAKESSLLWKLNWNKFAAYRVRAKNVDMVWADFGERGNLENFNIFFDGPEDKEMVGAVKNEILIKDICQAYNKTKDYPDNRRPLVLKKRVDRIFKEKFNKFDFSNKEKAKVFAERFMTATFISFENTNSGFQAPDFIKRKNAGFGFLNIVARINKGSGELDFWFQCHHACNDGVPVQEFLNKLKKEWPALARMKVSLKKYNMGNQVRLCSTKDKKNGIYLSTRFINFMDFFKLVKKINKDNSFPKVTPFRFFIWKLGNHFLFLEKKFIIPIDLASDFKNKRSLGFAAINPSSFYDRINPKKGLIKFQEEFDRQIILGLRRSGEVYELFKSFSLLPNFLYAFVAKFFHSGLKSLTADLGVSIIDKADTFIAPYSDIQTDGFIALSNFFTQTESGQRVCFVSSKGPRNKVNRYLDAIEEVARANYKW